MKTLLLNPLIIAKIILFVITCTLVQISEAAGQKLSVAGFDVEITGEMNNFDLVWEIKEIQKDLEILTITLTSPNPSVPPSLSLKWSLPSHNIAGFWSVTTGYRKTVGVSWSPSRVSSMLARSAPVFALFGNNNENRLNVAVSDALNTVQMSCWLLEEDARIHSQVDFFKEKHGRLRQYKVDIRFDKRRIRFYKALQEVPEWWASFPGYEPAQVP
ncbi:hypothetical protein KAS50_01515 [bacterium]|nr:hypothetical protein [bacterium]